MPSSHGRNAALALALSLTLAGCSPPMRTITLKGQLQPPSSEGVANAPANPSLSGASLLVTNLSGTLAKPEAAKTTNAQGAFTFDLRTDTLSPHGDWVKVAWRHPSKGGILLERTYLISQGQTGTLQGDLTDLSTLVTLALESERQINPSALDPAGASANPTLLENSLLGITSTTRTVLGDFAKIYYGYLGSSSTAPGADADLAQDAQTLLFP